MKNLLFTLSGALIMLLASGCPNPAQDTSTVKFDAGTSFTLPQGATGQFTGDPDFTIHFDKVTADSRCPVGVNCIRAGNADVALTIKSGSSAQAFTLTIGDLANGASTTATFAGYSVQLTGLEPLPKANQEIAQKDYKATLLVTK